MDTHNWRIPFIAISFLTEIYCWPEEMAHPSTTHTYTRQDCKHNKLYSTPLHLTRTQILFIKFNFLKNGASSSTFFISASFFSPQKKFQKAATRVCHLEHLWATQVSTLISSASTTNKKNVDKKNLKKETKYSHLLQLSKGEPNYETMQAFLWTFFRNKIYFELNIFF